MYLTNVEGICRRFVDEKRESLLRIKETTASFKAYWASQSANDRKALVQHKGNDMLKVRVSFHSCPVPDVKQAVHLLMCNTMFALHVRLTATLRTLESSRAVKCLTALLRKKSSFMRCTQELPHVCSLSKSLEHSQYVS